jgi:hypothetical protein
MNLAGAQFKIDASKRGHATEAFAHRVQGKEERGRSQRSEVSWSGPLRLLRDRA